MAEQKSSGMIINSFPVPNMVVDEIMRYLKPAEIVILFYLCRRTFGFHRDRERISLTQFEKGKFSKDGKRLDFGVSLSRPAIKKALKSLTGLGLIKCTKPAVQNPISQRKGAEYAVQTNDEKIDWPDLIMRLEGRKEADKKRMEHLHIQENQYEDIENEDEKYFFEEDF